MHEIISQITPTWLNRAYIYNGSIGRAGSDFRFRLEQDGKEKVVHAATYSRLCYEKADDIQHRDFSWDDAGVENMKRWLQSNYDAFVDQRSRT